jgi:hypothetical protein
MRSTKPVEPLDTIEQDVPISAEESAILWTLKRSMRMSTPAYLEWCTLTSQGHQPKCDLASSDVEPFEL